MLRFPNIIVIGLTGMSGAGKSTVSAVFRDKGFEVIDCDKSARCAANNRLFLEEVADRLSKGFINSGGTLDRAAVADAIYRDESLRGRYQRIIFPYIVYDIVTRLKSSRGIAVLDAPTLFESELDMVCDRVVCVTASLELCAKRIALRDGISERQALERLSAQHKENFFKENSDFCIENNSSAEDLRIAAERTADKMKGEFNV